VNPKSEIVADEKAACDECGNFEAMEIGGKLLCADCLSVSGSSCAGSPDDHRC